MSELSLKKPIGLVVGVVCAAVALSAMVAAPMSFTTPKPLYFLLGFEIVILVASVFGVLTAAGKFAAGPALSLACVMAVVGIGSLLADQSANVANPLAGPIVYHLNRWGVDWRITLYFALHAAAAIAIGLGAAWVVMARRPRESLASLARGLVFGAALLGLLAGAWYARSQAAGLPGVMRVMAELAVAGIALGLLAGAVHFTIQAFEFGRVRDDQPSKSSRTA